MKPISGYEDYRVMRSGVIVSLKRKKAVALAQSLATDYLNVGLSNQFGARTISVHTIVGLTYIPNPDNLPVLNHRDGNKLNNWDWNLEWCTQLHNIEHAFENGLSKLGEDRADSIYSDDRIRKVCSLLEEGLKPKEISILTGVTAHTVYAIRYRKQWRQISCKYNWTHSKYKKRGTKDD